MADGRLFTDYRPRCVLNFIYPPVNSPFLDSYKYRQHLIHNADDIINEMRAESYREAVCAPCVDTVDGNGTMLPEHSLQICDGRTCRKELNDPYGLGTGRVYGKSPQQIARYREFAQKKKKERDAFLKSANCCTTPKDNLAYHPLDPQMITSTGRLTVPYGGKAMSGGDPTTIPYAPF